MRAVALAVLLVGSLLAAPRAAACVGPLFCPPELPPAGHPLPLNAPALVGFFDAPLDAGALVALRADGGSVTLARGAPTGDRSTAFFSPPAWVEGETLTLQSDFPRSPGCSPDGGGFPQTTFRVLRAAPMPATLGTLVVGPPLGFPNTPPNQQQEFCGPAPVPFPGVSRSLTLQLTPEALPWLPLARLHVNGSTGTWGELAGGNASASLGAMSISCDQPTGMRSRPLKLELEIAGGPTLALDETIAVDCADAPPRTGCGVAPGSLWALLAVALLARRRM